MATPASDLYPWRRSLPELGSAEDLRRLRSLLAGYNLGVICRRQNVLQALSPRELADAPLRSPLDAFIRLFYDCLYTSESAFSPEALALLDRLGWIARDSSQPGSVYATAAIVPVADELTVCDRGSGPDGSTCPLPPDVVYPAMFENTGRYLAALPDGPCDAMLEIGTGAGIGAMLSARQARHVWATDITKRAVHFARLNCRLADLDNVTVLQGDLYSPVEGLTFDRIAIHPPWVPAAHSACIFGDGGEDGEAVLRGSVEGLPRFLRPGGWFYAVALATDRQGETFQERLRRWLGEAAVQFDIGMAVFNRSSPREFLLRNLDQGTIGEEALRPWLEMFRATHAEALVYGPLILHRHGADRESVTVRAETGRDYERRHLETLLEWEVLARSPGAEEALMAARPAVSPYCRLKTTSRLQEGGFLSESMTLESAGPLRSVVPCEEWLSRIVARCDSMMPWREHFERARSEGLIVESADPAWFAGLLASLVRDGILTCAVGAPSAEAG